MNKTKVLVFFSAFLFLFIFQNHVEARCGFRCRSKRNKKKAQQYCAKQKKRGIACKVSKWVGCGTGWTKAKRFGGRGKDYFACKPHKRASEWDVNAYCDVNGRRSGNYRFRIVKRTQTMAKVAAKLKVRKKGCRGFGKKPRVSSIWVYDPAGEVMLTNIMIMAQQLIKDPLGLSKRKRAEGCGVVAATQLMGYWHTERGYQIMDSRDRFNGTRHPYHTIREFYKISWARKNPKKSEKETFTTATGLKSALQKFVNKANRKRGKRPKLKVARRIIPITTGKFKRHIGELQKQLRAKNPVVLLFHSKKAYSADQNWYASWHYVVAVGYNSSKKLVYIVDNRMCPDPGGTSCEKPKNQMADSVIAIPYNQLKKTRMSMIWVY